MYYDTLKCVTDFCYGLSAAEKMLQTHNFDRKNIDTFASTTMCGLSQL